MLTHRSSDHPRPLVRTALPTAVRRALPVLALGVTSLALTLPTTQAASAAPRESVSRLTVAAQQAGLEPGNATMGWRERGPQRSQPAVSRYGRTPAAEARSSVDDFVPKGILGIDIASYQRDLDFSLWRGLDRRFVYIKATEGSSYRNPYFAGQYAGATDAGLLRGAYHFASPSGKAGYKQARYFVKNGGGWSPDGKTLPGVLDIEYNPYGKTCYGLSKKKMVAWVSSFTREYKKLTGKDAAIYTTTDWWKTCTGNSKKFATTNPLWIARYGTTKPGTLPKGWKKSTFWQYTSTPIDQDVFGNKMKRLRVLATTI